MSTMEIIGACAVALILLAYACFLTAFIVDDRAKKREAAIEATHAAAIASINEQLRSLRDVVNANADADAEVEAFVRMLADERNRSADFDGETEDEPVDEPPSMPAIWDRFATPLVLPPAPDVRTQLVDEPAWAGSTAMFDDLASKYKLHTIGRAPAPEDTRATTFTGDMAAYVRRITDAVDQDHDDVCVCVECQYEAIARAEAEPVRELAEATA